MDIRAASLIALLLFAGCRQQPAQAQPPEQESTPAVQTPTAPYAPLRTPPPVEVIAKAPLFALPPAPELSPAGESLVLDQEPAANGFTTEAHTRNGRRARVASP